jgi:hypothetical protein
MGERPPVAEGPAAVVLVFEAASSTTERAAGKP